MHDEALIKRIKEITGQKPNSIVALQGGMIGDVYRLDMDGDDLVAKVDWRDEAQLDVEGMMLRYLTENSRLPVPNVIASSAQLLLMTWVPGSSAFQPDAEEHAAELLAALHDISAETFGFHQNTLIGRFDQPNRQTPSWLTFFAEHRLRYMAGLANEMGLLSAEFRTRIENISDTLTNWLSEPAHPSLIHGDVWATNVLANDGQITAFLDPAIYFADAEIELAYIDWTNTFGESFYRRYAEIRPLSANFFDERRYIYSLYPILVHVLHFGRSYLNPLDQTLKKFGY